MSDLTLLTDPGAWVRGITIRQPWATCVLAGKTVENRPVHWLMDSSVARHGFWSGALRGRHVRDGLGRSLASVADDEIGKVALELLWGAFAVTTWISPPGVGAVRPW
ncbi:MULTISPECIES: hypothetical protein [unclassified Streptomyces]|uniref:hypothetical protein n=1 Tax=unclassified Streptomyces TaxID=2593676 RepID=UPI0033A33E61